MIFCPSIDNTPDHGPKCRKDKDKVHKDKSINTIIHFIKCRESHMGRKVKPFLTHQRYQPVYEIEIRACYGVKEFESIEREWKAIQNKIKKEEPENDSLMKRPYSQSNARCVHGKSIKASGAGGIAIFSWATDEPAVSEINV